MSNRIRAKFLCASETRHAYGQSGQRTYKFTAVYDPDLPEDQKFNKYTPSGSLEMVIDNPAAHFEPGRFYYLDFTPVDATPASAEVSVPAF